MRPRVGWKKKLTKFLKFFYLFFFGVVEILGDLFFFRKRHDLRVENPRRILIVKVDQFGDVLFSTFLLPLIKKKYPDVEIDYLVNPKTAPLLAKNPHVSQIYFWEEPWLLMLLGREKQATGGFRHILKKNRATLVALRARGYDVVINTRAYSPSSNAHWAALGKILIAFDISEKSFLADFWADYDLDEEEWKNYLNLLIPLGIDISSAEFHGEFYGLGENPMAGKGKYAVLSPVSFDKERQWGVENWRKLISFIVTKGCGVAITGTKGQEEYIRGILPEDAENVFIFTTLSLPDFGALMKGAEFFAGIDSFPAHLALATGRRAIVFANPGAYYLKGYSPKKFAVDARNMLPIIPQMHFFDLRTDSFVDAENVVGEWIAAGR
jgi:ADP-heptose:LPS heptosyltransferase